MKIRYIIAAAVFGAMTACTNEVADSVSFANDPDAVRILATVGDLQSRSNPIDPDAEKRKSFNVGDNIRVGADGQSHIVYTYDGTNWIPEDGKYLKWNKDVHEFSAYYPAATQDGVKSDQSTIEGLQASDLMWDLRHEQTKTSDRTITLNFQRRTARIVINKTIEWKTQYEGYSVTVLQVHSLQWGEDITVAPYCEHSENYYALVNPNNERLDNKTFLTIKIKENDNPKAQEITHTVTGIPVLKEGKSYQFELRIGRDKAEISSVTVEDWQPGTVVDGDIQTTEKGLETTVDANGITTYKVWSYPALQEVNRIMTSLNGKTEAEIDKIMESNIILMDNITLPSVADGESNWTPIGSPYKDQDNKNRDSYYVGTFDGNGYAITNMVIDQPTTANQALVSSLSLNGVIKNLTLIGCRVTASQYAAGILAKGNMGQVENCHVIATPGHDVVITAQETHWAAGVVCEISDNSSSYDYLTFKDCSLVADGGSVTITAAQSHAGGLAYRSNMSVANCHVKALNGGTISITANGTDSSTSGRAGGLMVTLDFSRHTMENCSVIADGGSITITGKDRVAGFISESDGAIKNCQVSGVNITGTSRVAGFIGILRSGTVETSSVTGCTITGTTDVNWAVVENQVEGYTPAITDGGENTVNGIPTK